MPTPDKTIEAFNSKSGSDTLTSGLTMLQMGLSTNRDNLAQSGLNIILRLIEDLKELEFNNQMALFLGSNSPTRLLPMPEQLEIEVCQDPISGNVVGFSHNMPLNATLVTVKEVD